MKHDSRASLTNRRGPVKYDDIFSLAYLPDHVNAARFMRVYRRSIYQQPVYECVCTYTLKIT